MAENNNREIRILKDAPAIAQRAADEFVRLAAAAIQAKGSFVVSLAGGSTPKAMNSLLAEEPYRSKIAWDKVYLFFGDERHAGPEDKDSNFKMTRETLFSKLTLRDEQVTRIKGEYPDTERAALEYEQALRAYFKLKDGECPRFDLLFLGMGEEGHCASLFPGTKALHPAGRIVVRNWVGKFYTERITLTAPAINDASQIIFAVTRGDKAPALKAVLEGPYEPEQLPSQLIQPKTGKLLWLIDQDAGSMLTTGIRE
jgi:6-phosphogluconolactonase